MMRRKRIGIVLASLLLVFIANIGAYAASPEVIKEIQQLLNEQGYECGEADGVSGAKTIAAVAQYQEDHGIDITGDPNEDFLQLLKDSSGAEAEPLLSSSGKTEEELQAEIAALQSELEELQQRKQDQGTDAVQEEAASSDQDPNATTWTLTAGYYYAGIDIPAGKFNAKAISGTGNLSSSNLFSGGINLMFGIDDGNGWYTDSYNGAKLPAGEYLEVTSNLVVQIDYTNIEEGASGRKYKENEAFELTSGNYTSGEDFSPGTYTVVAVSGSGNLSSSNIFDGGVNEMFGIDTGYDMYIAEFKNLTLPEGISLEANGLTIRMIPAEE